MQLAYSYHAVAGNVAHIPLHGGVFFMHPTKREQGTVGCIVTRNGKAHILSVQHGLGVATEGKPVYDSTGKVKIGVVADTKSSDPSGREYVDAALAATTVSSSFEIPRVGIPRGYTKPEKGMKIKMYGARSGYKTGRITATNVRYSGAKGSLTAFTHTITGVGGDSGSAIVNESNMVVGLYLGVVGTGAGVSPGTPVASSAPAIVRTYPGLSFVGKSGTIPPAINEPVALPPGKKTNEPKILPPNVAPSIDLGDLLPAGIDQNMVLIGGGVLVGLLLLSRRK